MPMLPVEAPAYNFPTGQARRPEPAPQPDVGWGQLFNAAYRQSNIVASALNNQTSGISNAPDEAYKPWEDIKGTKYEQYWQSFANANNANYGNALKAQIDMEEGDRRTLDASGWLGTLVELGANLSDPSVLVPGVGVASKVGQGYRLTRGLMAGAATGAIGVGVQEGGLQATQELRTAEESAVAVGFGVVLGGLIGTGAAALFSRAERKTAQAAYDNLLSTGGRNPVGSEAVARVTRDDLTVAGDLANSIAGATQINPVLRSNFRASGRVRELAQETSENSLYQAGNDRNIASPRAAETLARMDYEATLYRAVTTHDEIYANMKQAGVSMAKSDYEDAIGRAMRNGDVAEDGNTFVGQAARSWRENVFEPLKKRAIDAKLLPEDVSVETALSYFSRRYNQEMMTAREPEFKARVVPYIENQMREAYAADIERTNARIKRIDQELADLNLKPGERAATLDELKRAGQSLDAVSEQQIEKWSDIDALRQQAKEARKNGDTAGAADLSQRAKDLLASGGPELKAYLTARAAIRARYRKVDLNFAGLEDRTQQIQNRLLDLEDRNQRSLQRLIARGRVIERELANLSDEALGAKLDDLAENFDAVQAKSETTVKAHADAIEKIKADAEKRVKDLEQKAVDLSEEGQKSSYGGELEAMRIEARAMARKAESEAKVEELRAAADARKEDRLARAETLRQAADEARVEQEKIASQLKALAKEAKNPQTAKVAEDFANARSDIEAKIADLREAVKAANKDKDKFAAAGYRSEIEALQGDLKKLSVQEKANAKELAKVNPLTAPSIEQQALEARRKAITDRAEAEQRAFEVENKAQDARAAEDEKALALLLKAEAQEQAAAKAAAASRAKGETKLSEKDRAAYAALAKAHETKLVSEAKVLARLEQMQEAEFQRSVRLKAVTDRINAARDVDLDALRAEIQRGVSNLIVEVSDKSLSRGERAQRLQDRLADLGPEKLKERAAMLEQMKREADNKFFQKWEQRHLGEGVDRAGGKADFTAAARDVVDDIFDKLTGRAITGSESALPEYLTTISRGPMKDRTFNVPDALLTGDRAAGETNFLVDNVREVGDRYAKTMTAEIELKRKGLIGKEWDIKVDEVRTEYRELREAVVAAPTDTEALALVGKTPGFLDGFNAWRRGTDQVASTKERLLEYLRKDEAGAMEDLFALRDLVRGTYKARENASNYARVTRGLMAFNYIRLMGGVVLANFTEVVRPAMVHGFVPFFREGVAPLLTNMDAVKLSVKEAQQAGLVTERVLQHSMMNAAELADPYARGTAIERLLQNGSRLATKWNGLALWTDGVKSISSILSQNRILDGAIDTKDARLLAYLGIDKGMADRIAKQFVLYGETMDTVKVANTQRWDDDVAVTAYRAAVRKDVDSIIVSRGVGDVPLFANTPTGKMLLQFRSFNLAAHQRVMLRGLQEDKARFVGGLAVMTGFGMMAATMRSWRNGEESWEKFKQSAQNPGFLVGEGLDLTGIFPLAFELSNTAEKFSKASGAGVFNPIKTPLMAGFPDKSQQGSSTRYMARDPVSSLLGPTAGLPGQAMQALGLPIFAAQGEDPSNRQKKAAVGLIPFNSYLGFKEMSQMLTGDSPYISR